MINNTPKITSEGTRGGGGQAPVFRRQTITVMPGPCTEQRVRTDTHTEPLCKSVVRFPRRTAYKHRNTDIGKTPANIGKNIGSIFRFRIQSVRLVGMSRRRFIALRNRKICFQDKAAAAAAKAGGEEKRQQQHSKVAERGRIVRACKSEHVWSVDGTPHTRDSPT